MEFLEDNKRISWKTSSQYVWILRQWINSLNQLSVMCNKLPQTQQFKTTDASQFLLCQESRQSLTGAGDSHGSSRDAIKVLSRTVSARGLIVKGSASNCTYMAIVHVCVCVHVRTCVYTHGQSCLPLWDPMDCSPPGSSVHGILQAGILKWVAIPRGSSQPRS